MIAQITIDDHRIAGTRVGRRNGNALWHDSNSRRIDKQLVGSSALHYLGIAGDDFHAGLVRHALHAGHDPAQRRQRQPLLQNDAARQVERLGTTHRKIVDCASHRYRTDVTPRKKQWRNNIGVGREGKPVTQRGEFSQGHQSLVFQRF